MRILVAFTLALSTLSISSSVASAGLKVRYFKGQPTFVSAMPSSVVEVAAPAEVKGSRVGIGVAAFNLGERPKSLGYENISIRTLGGAGLRLIPYGELRHDARVRAGWETFFTALATGLNAYAASRAGYGHVGQYHFYNPVAGELAIDRAAYENAAMLNSVMEELDATMAKLDGVLRTTTIDPRTAFAGAVVFDLPRGIGIKDLIVTVTFAGDVHSVPLDGSAQDLEQASSSDIQLNNRADNFRPGYPTPTPPAPPITTPAALPALEPVTSPAAAPPENPKCGLVPQRDGSLLVVRC
jgi:hypothetical protein